MNTRPDNRQRIDAAFELMRKEAEKFELACVCAIDRPYKLRFERKSSGLFGLVESVKVESAAKQDHPSADTKDWFLEAARLPLSQLEKGAFPCAWCGDRSFHHCAQNCGTLVCGGRMQGDVFHCRPSCGATWVDVPLKEVEGEKRQELRAPTMPRYPSTSASPSVTSKLLLTGGQSLAVRRK